MAGATQERRLLGVGSSAMFGPAPAPGETVPGTFASLRHRGVLFHPPDGEIAKLSSKQESESAR